MAARNLDTPTTCGPNNESIDGRPIVLIYCVCDCRNSMATKVRISLRMYGCAISQRFVRADYNFPLRTQKRRANSVGSNLNCIPHIYRKPCCRLLFFPPVFVLFHLVLANRRGSNILAHVAAAPLLGRNYTDTLQTMEYKCEFAKIICAHAARRNPVGQFAEHKHHTHTQYTHGRQYIVHLARAGRINCVCSLHVANIRIRTEYNG